MKKLALTSLLAVVAVSGAHAANVIDGNPLYRPDAGRFVSETTLATHTKSTNVAALGEEFSYGITDKLSIGIATSFAQRDWFDANEWSDFGVGLNARVFEHDGWVADLYGSYGLETIWGDHASFLDQDLTFYDWTVGVRGGFVGNGWTLAGHVEHTYTNTESFNWDDKGLHMLAAGVDAQVLLNNSWNLVAGAEYNKSLNHYNEVHGSWDFMFGANYNIDATKYVGAYLTKEMEHTANDGEWDITDGFGVAVKFGIDF
ncbi:MAG: hypothetical protein IJ560_02135 [Alphaproteobacteria bacterium]|nr:hypothetical protein [Alphaproteobacteria bacterium]